MPRGFYFAFSRQAEQTLRFRYTCERCGFTTDWFPVTLTQGASKTRKMGRLKTQNTVLDSPKTLQKLQKKADKTLRKAISLLHSSLEAPQGELLIPNPFLADIFNEQFAAGRACPRCGFRQTWYPAVSERISPWRKARHRGYGLAFWGALAGALSGCVIFDGFWRRALTIAGFTTLAALLGAWYGYSKAARAIRRKKQHFESVAKPGRPEVDWGSEAAE